MNRAQNGTKTGSGSGHGAAGPDPNQLARLENQQVEARSMPQSPTSPVEVRAAGLRLEDLWLPAVTLHREALHHNLDRFARWCAEGGLELAPHAKTTMAPQLWAAQAERGAWGLTAATIAQARVMHGVGVSRVVIANEVTDPAQLAWLAESLADPGFEPMCLVDSSAGLELMEQALGSVQRRLPVLVELGVPGRRTGVRSVDEALDLAGRIARSTTLRLAGVEGFEGVFPQRRDDDSPDRARTWLSRLPEFVRRADAQGLFGGADEIVVTAGGSSYPDLVADAFSGLENLSLPVRPVVRSGCYITHDDQFMERASPLRSEADPDPLRPALSCFARVLSCPEPGRVLFGAGKRDMSFDIDLPVPRAVLREGRRLPVGEGVRVVELNDHHGFLDLAEDAPEFRVGDVIEFGLSHPCTVFDKWSLIPVLDGENHVVDAVRTVF